MKIAHLSVGDPFTAKWVNSQAKQGHDVHLIMLQPAEEELIGVTVHILPFGKPFGYYLNAIHLRKLLGKLCPDLLHVHYASGNGTLGRLSRFHPSVLSVWGSDVMVTPKESSVMRRVVTKNLLYYDWVCSTSRVMAESVRHLCPRLQNLSLTPIGVDTAHFAPVRSQKDDNGCITVGTVKTLHPIYGIDVLLQAFTEARGQLLKRTPQVGRRLRLLIVGEGPQRVDLESLATELGLSNLVEFTGQVPHSRIPEVLNRMDIFVVMSRRESFGVAVLEASACSLPVVVSNIGGLLEVAKNGITGFIVENENVSECADAIIKLVVNQNLREQMGDAGRQFVKEKYEWKYCMSLMNKVYKKVLERVSNKK